MVSKKTRIHRKRVGVLLVLALFMLIVGTSFYHFVEKWTVLDSLYFSVITLTTIGFGDSVPSSSVSKIFTMVYVFVGIGIILGLIRLIAKKELLKIG